jgi:glycosyltransferase involved in cell wall biosynthesis
MKVIMVYPHPDTEKGISIYSKNLVAAMRGQNIDVDRQYFNQGDARSLFKNFKNFKNYDIIHIQHEYNLLGNYGIPYFLLFGVLKIFKNKKVIVTMHTVLSQNEKFEESRLKTKLRKTLYKMQNRWMGITCSKVIVHAKSFKEILVEEYRIKEEKIVVLPHAIEDVKIIEKKDAKKKLNLKGNIFLLIGTMVPDHGHDIIINQADKINGTVLVATNPSTVNDRNENKISDFLELNKDIVKKNNFKNVRFDLGKISDKRWWEYFSAADIILLPYKGGIGSGIFADAMAAKRPVVSSNVKYFRNFSKDYGCLRLAKTERDFPSLIDNCMIAQNYKKMKKECERFFLENGLIPISKKYKELYESLK